jgi:dipeptidyl aminopeptidase/acylaminoacyl peptidase
VRRSKLTAGLALASLALASLAFCLAMSSCQVLNRSSGPQGLTGRIVWPKDGDLWVYDLASKQQTKITNLPSGAAVTGATWSPDGQRVVFAQFYRRPNERSSGADLMVANADGSNAHVFAERDAANTVLETPEWMPSGRVYYTVRRVTNGREAQSIVRQGEGGEPETLVENAYDPAVSPDETTLIYVRSTRAGQAMFKKTIGESGDGCELISDQVFQYLSLPRISLDAKRVAWGGSGEPNYGPSGCGGDPRSHTPAASTSRGMDLLTLLQPDVAEAHGLPADVYSMNLDGSDMTRVADIKDDDPTVAFSPDGSKLGIFGVAALFVVDAKGGPTDKLTDQGGYGGLDWTK